MHRFGWSSIGEYEIRFMEQRLRVTVIRVRPRGVENRSGIGGSPGHGRIHVDKRNIIDRSPGNLKVPVVIKHRLRGIDQRSAIEGFLVTLTLTVVNGDMVRPRWFGRRVCGGKSRQGALDQVLPPRTKPGKECVYFIFCILVHGKPPISPRADGIRRHIRGACKQLNVGRDG